MAERAVEMDSDQTEDMFEALFGVSMDALLTPIEDDAPCGGDGLETHPVMSEVERARSADDPTLPMGVWQHALKMADWARVVELCVDVLATKAKHLRFAAWLTEAGVHQHGMAGLRLGLDLVASLSEEYWDDLYPRIEEGDAEYRLNLYRWIATKLASPARLLPLTRSEGGEEGELTLYDWQQILRFENIAKRDADAARRAMRDRPDRTAFEASVSLTPVAFYEDLAVETEGALAEVSRLEDFLDRSVGDDAPSFAELRGVLEEIDERVRLYVESKGGKLPGSDNEVADEALEDTEDGAAPIAAGNREGASTMTTGDKETPIPSGPITGRAEAYKRLSEVAEYLIRTEPHSPVPYLIRRAVAWGDMSFGELLVQLIEGGGDHTRVLKLLGLDDMGRPTGGGKTDK